MISFNRDMNRTATPAVSATRGADSIQQWVNVALAGNNNALFASFTRVMGVELASATDYQAILDQNMFLWNSEMITANA
jgi:membrane protein required for beta-lactamase induction